MGGWKGLTALYTWVGGWVGGRRLTDEVHPDLFGGDGHPHLEFLYAFHCPGGGGAGEEGEREVCIGEVGGWVIGR